ncbi:MAG: TolC family protein [Candidatus Omnitrophica bacterium]|jgi:outer membrane protein TolC|nr:TolC family protein [Candidatus Omnitrophota bacterium]
MRKIIFSLILFIFILPCAGFCADVPLSIKEALTIGLRDNRTLLLKAQDVEKAKLEISASQAGLFPTLDFLGGWNYTQGYYNKNVTEVTSQFTLRQDLYTGGRVFNSIKYNGYKFEVTQALLDKAKLEIILDVAKAYYTLLLSDQYVVLNTQILENSKEHLNYIEARYKNGELSRTEVLKSKASLAAVEKAYDSSKMQLENTQLLLNNLLYLDKDVRITPQDKFEFQPKDVAFEQGFLKAMQTRPEIRQLEAQMKADKSAIEVAKSTGRPEIYASWDYYSRSRAVLTTINTKNWNDYSIIGLTVSWPIFDGWLTKAKVEQAIVDLKRSKLTQEKNIQDIGLEVKNTYLGLKNAIEQLKASEADLILYKENLFTAGKKYTQGEISFLDNHDAQLKYAVSSFNQNQAIYDYTIAKFSFDKATGGFYEI